ncbi:MAG: O-methyltransferase [Candidatus Delongbacteria bacterium]|nr:O-methyltransferase [Candidatus Delongbacteria bacterium]
MFNEISDEIKNRMGYLESIDKKDRIDGTERLKRLRQIPPETGKFICLFASNCPNGNFLEIGTSAGYSTMWLSLVAREKNIKIKTFELLEEKIKLARETFDLANINDYVELIEGDALQKIDSIKNIAFCFIDCEKEIYEECWDKISPKIIKNGIIIADNAINHYETIKPMIDKALNDSNFDSLIVPIGKGELVCRRK